MPVEGKRKLAAAGKALDSELEGLLAWMRSLDEGLGRSAQTAASKMRYQMNRLRRLAANFQLQKQASLTRHAQAITIALYPEGGLQEPPSVVSTFLVSLQQSRSHALRSGTNQY